jgi:plastocyanin
MGERAIWAGCGLGVAVVLGLGACGDDDGAGALSDGPSAESAELEDVVVVEGDQVDIRVIDNTFDAQNIQVRPGTKVIWTNQGRQDHDIVPVDETASWGAEPAEFEPDAVYEHTFDEPGTHRYFCSLHGTADAGMIGAVVVED